MATLAAYDVGLWVLPDRLILLMQSLLELSGLREAYCLSRMVLCDESIKDRSRLTDLFTIL